MPETGRWAGGARTPGLPARNGGPAVELRGVGLVRDGRRILEGVDWTVQAGQHWVLLGPNGSGKTTLARVATLWEHPTSGRVRVLGEELGATDVRSVRGRIGFVSSAMADMVRPSLSAFDVVLCGLTGALEPWWHRYDAADRAAATATLAEAGLSELAQRRFGTLSSGERQRVLLARAHVADPALVVLDEPNAGLDLAGREELLDSLDARAAREGSAPILLVTHHVEEIPPSFTHLLALRGGRVLAAGPIDEVLGETVLQECFGVQVALGSYTSSGGRRWSAHRR